MFSFVACERDLAQNRRLSSSLVGDPLVDLAKIERGLSERCRSGHDFINMLIPLVDLKSKVGNRRLSSSFITMMRNKGDFFPLLAMG
jgi:hypothetical protein